MHTHWVFLTSLIYLYMDNVCRHSRMDDVIAFVATLMNNFNVIICYQYLRVTNMLAFDIWLALQNVVKNLHFRQHTEVEALYRTDNDARASSSRT